MLQSDTQLTASELESRGFSCLELLDDVVLKNYLSRIDKMNVLPLGDKEGGMDLSEIRLFKITEMVYEKDEYATPKFTSVFNTLTYTNCVLFLLIDAFENRTDFYMGVKGNDAERTTTSIKDALHNALKGNFPGIKTSPVYEDDMGALIRGIKSKSISVVSCVAGEKEVKKEGKNSSFIQGLEKLVNAMQGKRYTAIMIANAVEPQTLNRIRKGYENIYTQLSPLATSQVSYATTESVTLSQSVSKGRSFTESSSNTESDTVSESHTRGESTSETRGESVSQENLAGRLIKGFAVAAASVAAVAASGAATALTGGLAAPLLVGAAGSAAAGSIFSKQHTKSTSSTFSTNQSQTTGSSRSESRTSGISEGVNENTTEGNSLQNGSTKNVTLTLQNKEIVEMLNRIDKQIKRMDTCESLGMWESATYFLADDLATSEVAAATYRSIVQGEKSGVEVSAINTWRGSDCDKINTIRKYITNFRHPLFQCYTQGDILHVTPGSMVNSNELAIQMGLPRKSVVGFRVSEHAVFGKSVFADSQGESQKAFRTLPLGKVYDLGRETTVDMDLSLESLAMHSFITGSTGSGKSNTIYSLLKGLKSEGIKFMVIEPTKGEYKHVFGMMKGVRVLGTNPSCSELLKINPFKFPEGIHVLEHVDRLVDIFNVCWPMYAAMPAVLKDAILNSYKMCGWDLLSSSNEYGDTYFPTFQDVQEELVRVINQSAYSQELKGNYMGSLSTRINSLTNGLNGLIFSSKEIDNRILFDTNVIVDLSRVGASETKSLIMGLLVMRLNEYRMTHANGMNSSLKHVTVLEEAHNILKRTSTEQSMEGANLTGKSVEMISNAIAEMRTYGEGFIIADQSPTSVDLSAIKNTNTKIIMRLPDESDRRLAGKAAALKDDQLDEIAKLHKGVAVVYQNDWIEPVLCKVKKYEGVESVYQYNDEGLLLNANEKAFKMEYLKLLYKGRVNENIDPDIDSLERLLTEIYPSTGRRIEVEAFVREYKERGFLSIWNNEKFQHLSEIVSSLLNASDSVSEILNKESAPEYIHSSILQFIDKQLTIESEEIRISICQSLIAQGVVLDNEKIGLYESWRNYILN